MFGRKLFDDYVRKKPFQNLTITVQLYNGLSHLSHVKPIWHGGGGHFYPLVPVGSDFVG